MRINIRWINTGHGTTPIQGLRPGIGNAPEGQQSVEKGLLSSSMTQAVLNIG
jgi:hypothetical protein